MEPLDNRNSLKPSKRFLIRGGVATLLIVLILTVQTTWFRKLFSKISKNESDITINTTVGDVVTKDSNDNGIPDWQEKLWGLDPTVATTNGVSNKVIIEQKRKSLEGENGTSSESLNETDILARQIYGLTTAVGQSGSITSNSFASIGADLGKTIDLKEPKNKYSINDIVSVKTTSASLKAYFANVSNVVATYDDDVEEISLIISALENEDFSRLNELSKKAIEYKALSKKLKDIKTPIGVAGYHLSIVNGLYGMGESFEYISELENNGINALAGISIYKNYALSMDQALINMHDYLLQYGIINE